MPVNTEYFTKLGSPGSATFLASPGHSIGGTTFTVDSTSLWPTDTAVFFGVDTTSLVGGVPTRDVGSYTVWEGVVTSATQITSCTLRYGTDQAYSAGSTTRVYILPTTSRENRFVDGILVDHSQAGAHEVATNYDPSNPMLETQKWVGVASAVNEITVTNAATGNAPLVSATGGDTNVNLNVQPKGTTGIAQILDGNGNEVLKAGVATTSAVNEITVTNAATTGSPNISATGGDTNINLALTPKGNGLVKGAVLRQDDTTNTYQKGNTVTLTGWGVITAAAAATATETVTFGVTFSQRPIVTIAPGGDSVATFTYGAGGTNVKIFTTMAHTITTGGFTVHARSADGTNWSSGNAIFYQWVAIGEI